MTPAPSTSATCPVCRAKLTPGQTTCPSCHEDLTALALLGSQADLHYNAGLRLARSGDLPGAIGRLQAALALNAEHLESRVVLGKLLAQQGRYAEAIACWQRALQTAPGEARAQSGIRKAQELLERQRRSGQVLPWVVRGLGGLLGLAIIGLILALAIPRGPAPAAVVPTPVPPQSTGDRPVAPTPTLVPTPTEDPSIGNAVIQALAADPALKTANLGVRQSGGAIYLSGAVPSAALKAKAETLAKAAGGGRAVDASGIGVTPPDLAKAVLQALQAEPLLAGVKVEQRDDGVRLSGSLPSGALKTQAETLAAKTSGVNLVDSSQLLLAPPPLAAAGLKALQADPRTAALKIDLAQSGYDLRASGSVPSAAGRLAVEQVLRGVASVRLVDVTCVAIDPPRSEYIVQAGDTLSGIAARQLGDWTKWTLILEANKAVVKDARLLLPGTRLVVPSGPSQPPALPAACGPLAP